MPIVEGHCSVFVSNGSVSRPGSASLDRLLLSVVLMSVVCIKSEPESRGCSSTVDSSWGSTSDLSSGEGCWRKL